MNEKILVTGAQGFVGRYTVAALLARGASVVGTGRSERQDLYFTHDFDFAGDRLPAPLPAALKPPPKGRYSYAACDLADAEAVSALVRELRPDRVIHLAGVLRDEAADALARCNTAATRHLATAIARFAPNSMLLLGSSGSVYGDQPHLPVSEFAEPAPVGAYAVSKRESEVIADRITQTAGLPLAVARIFNLVGPGIQSRHLPGHLAHKVAEIEAGAAEPEVELGSLSATRDLIDVRDVALWLASLPRVNDRRYYNLAAGVEVPMHDLVAKLAEQAKVPFAIKSNTARNRVGSQRSVAVTSIREVVPSLIPLEQSVRDMLDYARFCISPHRTDV